MTTIAYKAGVLAADTGVFDRDVYCGRARKIGRLPAGGLFGVAGTLQSLARFTTWVNQGCEGGKPELDADSEALIVRKDDTVHWYGATQDVEIEGPYHAIGSGFRVAMGAMAAGASAIEAVEICARLDAYTRAPLEFLVLNETEPVHQYGRTSWT